MIDQYKNLVQQKIQGKIHILKTELTKVVCQKGIKTVFKKYNKISRQLVYLLKFGFILNTCTQYKIQESFKTCLQILTIITEASQYQKFGHFFSNFKYIIERTRKDKNNTKWHIQIKQQNVLSRIAKNQEQQYIQSLRQIQVKEFDFLNHSSLNNIFGSLCDQNNLIQNPSCICCTKIFNKNFKIINRNPTIHTVIAISQKQKIQKLSLLKYLCGICNSGGGVLIIGGKKIQKVFEVTGIKVKNLQEVIEKENLIKQSIFEIKPPCLKYKIEKILVINSLFDIEQHKEQLQSSKIRICLRVLVIPYSIKRISYLHLNIIKQYKTQQSYEVYKISHQQKPVKLLFEYSQNCLNIYQTMHKFYKQKKPTFSNHQNILCFNPVRCQQKILKQTTKIVKKIPIPQSSSSSNQSFEKQKDPCQNKIKFKYQHASLLIVRQQIYYRNIEMFQKAIKNMKQTFQMFRPFQGQFSCVRQIALICHERNFIQLRGLMKICQDEQLVQKGYITMMPVYSALEIQKQKITKAHLSSIQKKFLKRFKNIYEIRNYSISDKFGADKNMIGFVFLNYNQSVYAYLIFQELGLKPYFIKLKNNKKQ